MSHTGKDEDDPIFTILALGDLFLSLPTHPCYLPGIDREKKRRPRAQKAREKEKEVRQGKIIRERREREMWKEMKINGCH